MLTPDEGHLDRRIAQEAGTLTARGWEVDIYPAADPGLDYEADLPAGVRLLVNPGPVRAAGGRGCGRSSEPSLARRHRPAGSSSGCSTGVVTSRTRSVTPTCHTSSVVGDPISSSPTTSR